MNWLHDLFHWMFIGDEGETFLGLWHAGPHIMWEMSMNVVETLVVFLIFRPIAKLWFAHTKKRLRTEIHAELDAELGIDHAEHDHHPAVARQE
jgi:hypothetical protein